MTSAGSYSTPKIYPNYCHYLSPTIGKWCPLWATDVRELKAVGIFSDGGQLLHFGNHPVKWVRLTGVIVAVDSWERGQDMRKIYTLDDSSGACIVCSAVVAAPEPVATRPIGVSVRPERTATGTHDGGESTDGQRRRVPSVTSPCVPWEEIRIGTVVKVKGRVVQFWGERRVKIVKVEVVRCTDVEVRCWNEVRTFRRDILARPWHLSIDEQQQCLQHKRNRTYRRMVGSQKRTKLDE